MLLIKVADERRLPFKVKAPAQMTGRDIEDLPTDVSNGGC
jgi:antitoxin component of RelBE/YafQ-DinJ toxin-antitoxin module